MLERVQRVPLVLQEVVARVQVERVERVLLVVLVPLVALGLLGLLVPL